MNNILLTPGQTRVLWTAIEEESNFSSFQFAGVNLASVWKLWLKLLEVANTSLTTEQVKQLLKSLLSDNCAMENLDFSANILSMIEPDLMAKSLNKLKVVTLLDSDISVIQVGKNIISCN